ncbi:MAG: hypothetical protein R6X06_00475 [Gammaproteobacteria bacterium]
MHTRIELAGHDLAVELTPAAEQALAQSSQGICAEMELYFSCLIRKKVRFHDLAKASGAVAVSERLGVTFRPVMTRACGTDYAGEEPPVTDFPLHKAEAFMPRWLKIDFRQGEWQGEYGFTA